MDRAVVIASLVVTFLCVALRTVPRVVTGVGFYTALQAVAWVAILRVLFRRRREIGTYFRTNRFGRHVVLLATIGMFGLLMLIVMAVQSERAEGRVWDRVEPDLVRDEPLAALDLAGHLRRVESGPLRVRILERIAELGNDSPAVVDQLRIVLGGAEDRSVVAAAVQALGKLMTDRDVIGAVADLPRLAAEGAELLGQALRLRTGQSIGADPAEWRIYVAREIVPAPGVRGFEAALVALRELGDAPEVRVAAIGRIGTADGADRVALRDLVAAAGADLRAAAATALGRVGRPTDVFPLLDQLRGESDAGAAAAQARAILALDEERGRKELGKVVTGGRTGTARDAAATALE